VACREQEKPASLATSTLDGPRRVAGPVCLEEAIDASGSMTEYIPQRERAERELFAFARRALAPDDRVSEVYFAGSAALTLPPTPLASLTGPPPPAGGLADSTLLTPAIATLVAARTLGPDDCAARALVMITDGLIGDEQQVIQEVLARARYTRMYAVVPAGVAGGDRGYLRGGLLDSVTVYAFHSGGFSGRAASILGDAKPLDVIFGEILGDLTGQRLARTEKTSAAADLWEGSR
jgi:hypothetical protein